MTGVEIVLNKLKGKFEFVIVTSRNEFETEIAKEKLSNIGFNNVTIFNNEHYKIERLLSEKVDYIIDDDEVICKRASDSGITALYFKNNASNRIVDKNNIRTLSNPFVDAFVPQITQIINELFPESYPANIFKNITKCRAVEERINTSG